MFGYVFFIYLYHSWVAVLFGNSFNGGKFGRIYFIAIKYKFFFFSPFLNNAFFVLMDFKIPLLIQGFKINWISLLVRGLNWTCWSTVAEKLFINWFMAFSRLSFPLFKIKESVLRIRFFTLSKKNIFVELFHMSQQNFLWAYICFFDRMQNVGKWSKISNVKISLLIV